MTSLQQRIETLAAANQHYLASLAMKENSLAIVDAYIRKAQDVLKTLQDPVTTMESQAKNLRQKEREYQARMEELDQAIDLFLQRDRTELALEACGRYNTARCLVALYKEYADRQEIEHQALLQARGQLEAKLKQIQEEREQLQILLEGSLNNTGMKQEAPDRLADVMQQRLDQATAQGQTDIAQLEQELAQVLEVGLIQAQLSERRRRLNRA